MQQSEQPVAFLDHKNKGDRAKNCASGDDDGSYVAEEGVDRNNESGREKKDSPWHRVKWTDEMVKLLITAVSYIGEDASFDCNGNARRRSSLLPKKGKWKCISKVMAERGCLVSPQQCEDKFNDLNKRYKRLNEMLGRGTSCKVVEDPTLLDLMDLPDKAKETVRKILSSKQLFYEEMCSYHNGNRLYLPHDRALQGSLLLALRSKDDDDPHESRPHRVDALDEEDHVMECDDQDDETEEDHASHKGNGRTFVFPVVSAKRKKQGEEHEIRGRMDTESIDGDSLTSVGRAETTDSGRDAGVGEAAVQVAEI
ncbi:hypothetical protein F0562_028982 [Nyssa sinensis]|uniref:Myb/SANT-like DNA-binding domain-containing protein n=1 Tax=Nyssa sinensis TaxID=561372 RepID=A0A5J5B1I9_9ASTE|nr:hypothetical protein F0562_028982 [Nyssa sinensis]